MPATPLAQSSEPPDAAYCKHVVHYHLYHFIIIIYTLNHNWLMISFFDKDPKYLLNQHCQVRVDYSFAINNLHTITLVRTTFIWKSERSMDSPRVV